MFFHRGELFVGELAGFEQDRVGDADLSEVMQGSGLADHRDHVGLKAGLCGKGGR